MFVVDVEITAKEVSEEELLFFTGEVATDAVFFRLFLGIPYLLDDVINKDQDALT